LRSACPSCHEQFTLPAILFRYFCLFPTTFYFRRYLFLGSPSPDPSPVLESPAKSSSSKSSSPKKDVTSPHPTGFIEDNSESIEAARSDSVPAEREEDVEQRSKTMWTRSTTPRERRGQGRKENSETKSGSFLLKLSFWFIFSGP
jgi:hypothetical protein